MKKNNLKLMFAVATVFIASAFGYMSYEKQRLQSNMPFANALLEENLVALADGDVPNTLNCLSNADLRK